MKSFFKKLAFVMALAMVVSLAAPAATAAHADEAGIALQGTNTIVATYELEKAGASVDFCFKGAPKDWKTTFKWTSSDEAVATVDKAGVVTAVAAGTATITITAGADASYVQTVKVTVKEEKKADAFTVSQVNSDTVKLTFNAKQNVTVDNLGFAMLIGDVYVTVPVKAVSVNENVATVTLFTKVSDGQVYRFTFGENVVDFTASAGAVDHVVFTYYTGDDPSKNVGIAYVSTEAEPCEVTLVPVLYDANNVDVTSLYDLDEFSIEFEPAVESDAYEMTSGETICFEKAAAAIVDLSVAWTDEETGEDVEKTYTGVVVAQNRPALKVTIERAGFINYGWMAEAEEAANDFYGNYYDYFWNNWWNSSSWTFGDWENGLQFSALAHDNRGNKFALGADYEYGYFTFSTSNEDVLDITDDGDITIIGDGTATVLIYFVDTTGDEDVTTFIGAQKITVYPKRYPATYKIASTSATTITDGATTGNFKLTVYDQYNKAIQLVNDTADITVEATSDTNEVTELDVAWNNNGYYEIRYNGADFAEMVGDSSSKTFKYKVTVDKEANELLTSSSTANLTLKVVNTATPYAKLNAFLNPEDAEEGVEEATKFYYKTSQNTSSVDVYVNQIANFMNESDGVKAPVKTANVSLKYLTANNGYTLANVPVSNICLLEENQTTGDAGIVYFTVEAPKNAYRTIDPDSEVEGDEYIVFDWDYEVKNGKIELKFNTAEETFHYAVSGDYKVTLKTASKDAGTLKTLATYTFAVSNSQPEVTYNKYDEEVGNKTSVNITSGITQEQVKALVRSNLEFKYKGADVDMSTAQIWWVEYKAVDGKVRIDKVHFGVEVDDGNDGISYYYESIPSVKKWIYTE